MEHTVRSIIESQEMLLKHYEQEIDKMIAGTYVFDTEHMTEKMIIGMTVKKARITIESISYLRTLPENEVILFDRGYNKEYKKYLEIVNQ